MQENTFTNWVNRQLRTQKVAIGSLSKDLCDGVLLIALLEVLSKKKMGQYVKAPTNEYQKLENLAIAISFIKGEGIHLVNCGKLRACIANACAVDQVQVCHIIQLAYTDEVSLQITFMLHI